MFIPLVDPPPDIADPPLWFVVGTGSVALLEQGEPPPGATFLGLLDGQPVWAADAADVAADAADLGDLRALYGRVPDDRWVLAGRAVQLVEWQRTHRFCGRCATPTEAVPGERAMRCPACGLLAFPRLAPAVIVLVRRGDDLLLARGRQFPLPMYSTLAGFVEPGETIEEAVHREVREEVGIELAGLGYFGSQPWPFPHSLMLGFTADWASGEIVIDEREIVDAQWFSPDDLPMIPPAMSIARRLIDAHIATVRS